MRVHAVLISGVELSLWSDFSDIVFLEVNNRTDFFPFAGGAETCVSVHVGEIRPRGIRGNHRHYSCNETFVIWGAKTLFRVSVPPL